MVGMLRYQQVFALLTAIGHLKIMIAFFDDYKEAYCADLQFQYNDNAVSLCQIS